MLLGVETDNERRDVDDLLADTDVTLADEDTGVVDRLGEARLEDLSLKTALKEILDLEGKHVIETHALLVEHTDADQTTDQGCQRERDEKVSWRAWQNSNRPRRRQYSPFPSKRRLGS